MYSIAQRAGTDEVAKEAEGYLDSDLITYIGNKRGLLPFIERGIEQVKHRLGKEKLDFLDLFSGSGVVSRRMKAHAARIVSNDLEHYTSVVNRCYLSNRADFPAEEYRDWAAKLEILMKCDWRRGFIAELYAPLDDANIQPGERVFYTRRNAEFIDTACQHIATMPSHLQGYFLGPLIVRASIHNNTGGVFKGFYKNREGLGAFGGEGANALSRILGDISIPAPRLSNFACKVEVTRADATRFAAEIGGRYDLVYMDPPYNQHPYGSNYFMLNLISEYKRPEALSRVSGIPEGWQRSPFNKPKEAAPALFNIIDSIDARFFLISYNSEGFVQKEEFIAELGRHGTLTTLETRYNTYRASRNLAGREQYVTEYLFLLER